MIWWWATLVVVSCICTEVARRILKRRLARKEAALSRDFDRKIQDFLDEER